MRALRRSAKLATTSRLAALVFLGGSAGCAEGESPTFPFAPDATADASHATSTSQGGGQTTATTAHSRMDAGFDSTFGFDAYVPPTSPDSGSSSGMDSGEPPPSDSGKVDAKHEAGEHHADAGIDAGPPPFIGNPGTACTIEGQLQSKPCGLCGHQLSTCIKRPDGGVAVDAGAGDAGDGDAGTEGGPGDASHSRDAASHDGSTHHDGGADDAAKHDGAPSHDATTGEDAKASNDAEASHDAGPPLVWSDFGPCDGQVDGGCVPGTSGTPACGPCNLGTESTTCASTCTWNPGVCTGVPETACIPGSVNFAAVAACTADGGLVGDASVADASSTTLGSTVAGTSQTCSNTCDWEPETSCEFPPSTLTISPEAEGTVTTIVNLSTATETPLVELTETFPGLFTGCPSPGERSNSTPYGFVTAKNPSSTKSVVVSAWSWQVPGTPMLSIDFAAYSTFPLSQAQYLACVGQVVDICTDNSDPTSCNGSYGGLMIGDGNQVTIPAGGTLYFFVQDRSAAAGQVAPVAVTIRTESLE